VVPSPGDTKHMKKADHRTITNYIKKNYAQIAQRGSSASCCSGGSCCDAKPQNIDHISTLLGYRNEEMQGVSEGANLGLGCGNPLAFASIHEGQTVVDLGSGGGFDCFLARRLVGDTGKVIGIDMTVQMIELAQTNASRLGYTNVEFIEGAIEDLPVEDQVADVIISNCVINLSLDKQQVFHEAFRVLKRGGKLTVSDVVAIAELPKGIKQDLKLYAGCVAGAEPISTIENMLRNAGFTELKFTPKDTSKEILTSWLSETDLDQYVASYIIEGRKPN